MFLKNQPIIMTVNFSKDCILSSREEISCIVYKIDDYRMVFSAMGNTKFVVPERTLDYGAYKIIATVYLHGEHVKEVYGVIKGDTSHLVEILPSPLVAYIKGGENRSVGNETSFNLDGSQSHDPDSSSPFSDPRLLFRWYCKVLHSSGNYIGCYNNDYLIHFSESKVFITDSANMVQGKTYIFRLEVTKVNRKASFEQRVLIVAGTPPKVVIR